MVHNFLCDNFDTPNALKALFELASTVNDYMKKKDLNILLLNS